jgi:hypothetical protein
VGGAKQLKRYSTAGGIEMRESMENARKDLLYSLSGELEELRHWCESPESSTAPWVVREAVLFRMSELTMQIKGLRSLVEDRL